MLGDNKQLIKFILLLPDKIVKTPKALPVINTIANKITKNQI